MTIPQKNLRDIIVDDLKNSLQVKYSTGRLQHVDFDAFMEILVKNNQSLLVDERDGHYVLLPYKMKKQCGVM